MSADEMPCGCLGHFDNEAMCRYPALKAETNSLREQVRTLKEQLDTTHGHVAEVARLLDPEVVPDACGLKAAVEKRMAELRTLTAERDAFKECVDDVDAEFKRGDWVSSGFSKEMLERARAAEAEADALRRQIETLTETLNNTGAARAEMESAADALRARVTELEADSAYHAKAQCIVDKESAEAAIATARDAALEEAAQKIDAAEAEAREAMNKTDTNTPIGRAMFGRWEQAMDALGVLAEDVRTLKTHPARRFVEAKRVIDVLRSKGSARYGESPEHDVATQTRNETLEDLADALGLSLDEVKP